MRSFFCAMLVLFCLSVFWAPSRAIAFGQGPGQDDKELRLYYLSSHVYADDTLGVRVEMPAGWNLLRYDNPFVNMPSASMIAVHGETACFAVLLLERVNGSYSLDQYLDLVAKNRREKEPSFVEEGRDNVQFGGRQGRMLRCSWTTPLNKLKGFSAVCTDDFYYYLLTGWSAEDDSAKAFVAFKSLQQEFRITKSREMRLDDDAKALAEQYPYVTLAGTKMMCQEALKRRLSYQGSAHLGQELMEKGRAALSQTDRDEFDSLMAAALMGLDEAGRSRAVVISNKATSGQSLDAADV
ncbi:MAG TPA: hypothetical protein VI756_01835, partial [Blastocatellia bacterium]